MNLFQIITPQALSIHLISFNLSSYEQNKHLFDVTCLQIFPPVGKQGDPSPALPPPPSIPFISNKKSFSFALQFGALPLHTVHSSLYSINLPSKTLKVRNLNLSSQVINFPRLKQIYLSHQARKTQQSISSTYHLIKFCTESFSPIISEKRIQEFQICFSKSKPVHDLPFVCQDSHPCCDFD